MVAPVAIPAAFGAGLRDDALGLVGGEDRHGRPRHEAPQAGGGRADAGDDDRPASGPQRGADGAEVGRGASAVRVPCGDGGSRRGRVEVEVDGAGRPGQAQRDRRPHVRCGRRRAEDERALGDRTEQRGVVEALVGDALAARGRHAVADEQEGLAVEQRVRDAVHRARGAGTAGDDAGARAAGELGRGRGHEHRRALGVGEHEAEALGLGRPDDVEVAAAAGQPEQDLDPRVA